MLIVIELNEAKEINAHASQKFRLGIRYEMERTVEALRNFRTDVLMFSRRSDLYKL